MTSAADTAQHPDPMEISDFTEGLLPAAREVIIRRHIDTCDGCGDVHASLEEIRSLLGDSALHEPMPADVADRISAALAGEAAVVVETPQAEPVVSRETVTPSAESTAVTPPAGRPRAATGPGRRSSRRRRWVILGTAFGAAAIGMSAFLLQSFQPSHDSAGSRADKEAGAAKKSLGDFSEGSLEGHVKSLLSDAAKQPVAGHAANDPSSDTKSSPANASSDNATPLWTPAVNVPSCVQEGTGRSAPALALEKGSYHGTASYLVVLPHSTDPSRVQSYVVDASCVSSAPTVKGRLLLTRSYTRP